MLAGRVTTRFIEASALRSLSQPRAPAAKVHTNLCQVFRRVRRRRLENRLDS